MGSRPSTSISPGEARENRSRTAHPNEGDQTSNEVAGPEESTLGYEDYQERREWRGYNPRLLCAYDPRSYPRQMSNLWGADDEARGDHNGAADGSRWGIDLEPGMVDDDAVEDDYYSSIGVEAAYCRAAAGSHAAGVQDGEPGGNEVGPIPFGGQGSVMYSYRESRKMRFGTCL